MTFVLGSGNFINSLRRAFRLTGRTPFTLDSSILSVAQLTNVDEPPFHYKGGGSWGQTQPAVAAESALVGIVVPTTYTGIIVVRRIGLNCETGSTVELYGRFTDDVGSSEATVGPLPAWDLRSSRALGAQVVTGRSGTAAVNPFAAAEPHATVRAAGSVQEWINGPFVLGPGNELHLWAINQNFQMHTTFYWDQYDV